MWTIPPPKKVKNVKKQIDRDQLFDLYSNSKAVNFSPTTAFSLLPETWTKLGEGGAYFLFRDRVNLPCGNSVILIFITGILEICFEHFQRKKKKKQYSTIVDTRNRKNSMYLKIHRWNVFKKRRKQKLHWHIIPLLCVLFFFPLFSPSSRVTRTGTECTCSRAFSTKQQSRDQKHCRRDRGTSVLVSLLSGLNIWERAFIVACCGFNGSRSRLDFFPFLFFSIHQTQQVERFTNGFLTHSPRQISFIHTYTALLS